MYTLLIVDDEIIIADGLCEMIQEAMSEVFIVYCCYTAKDVLRLFEELKIDVLMTDINMPNMTGFDLQMQIRDKWPECYTVFLTGYSDYEYVRQAIRQSATAFVLKSDGDEEIIATLGRIKERLDKDREQRHERLGVRDANHESNVEPVNFPWTEVIELLRMLHEYLMTGHRDMYKQSMKQLCSIISNDSMRHHAAMLHNAIYALLHKRLFMLPQDHPIRKDTALSKNFNDYSGSTEAFSALNIMAEFVFDAHEEKSDQRRQKLINDINTYIRDNIRDDVSLTRIADVMGFHPVYLSRIYKECMSIGISDYILNLRIKIACEMLKDSNQQIQNISKSLGFSNPTYFSRFFRKNVGITPQEYRDGFTDISK